MKKRVLIMIIALLVLVVVCVFNESPSSSDKTRYYVEASQEGLTFNEKEGIANALYQDIISEIDMDGQYPLWYAGGYINSDSVLVIVLVEDNEDIKTRLLEIAQGREIQFGFGEYPLQHLRDTIQCLSEQYQTLYTDSIPQKGVSMEQQKALLDDVSGFYVDEEKNRVVVKLNNITDEKIELFNAIFHADYNLLYEEGGMFSYSSSPWKPGRAIYDSVGHSSSTGYRCYWYNSSGTQFSGFAAAGHAFDVNETVYLNSNLTTVLGVCKAQMLSGNSDVSFIAITNSNYYGSNTVYYSNGSGSTSNGITLNTSGFVSSVPQGTSIYKVGKASYLTSGTVISNTGTITIKGNSLQNMLQTSAYTYQGDSGGCAYVYMSGSYYAVGTVSGCYYSGSQNSPSTFICSYFSKLSNAMTDLGIQKY